MHVHMWCHAVFHVENSISFHGNINLHVTRRGISPHRIFYMKQDYAVDAPYTTHDNNY